MLQGINQRLKTAESSLGSGGANTVTINAGMQQPTVLGGGIGGLAEIANNLDAHLDKVVTGIIEN